MPTDDVDDTAQTPSPVACLRRRTLAKLVDILLFGALSLVVGRLLLPDPLSLSGLVPAFGTTLWALGFFVAADTLCAQLLGATPGEFLAGVRVCMADGARLTWTARQDRTTDALVDGTVRAPVLLRSLMRGQPAPYDRDWKVRFLPASPAQRLVAGAGTAIALIALFAAAVWLIVVKGLEADAQVAASKVMRYVGIPARAVWANPTTGLAVELPDGWFVRRAVHHPSTADWVVDFECESGAVRCGVRLAAITQSEVGMLDPDRDTVDEAIERTFAHMFNESNAMVVDARRLVQGAARLEQIYSVELHDDTGFEGAGRAGLAWFTDRKHSWVMAVSGAQPTDDPTLAHARRELALALIESTGIIHGH